jgi:hypothetical protein
MAAPTDFLYGDSTPSPLKGDFIAFLRDAVDFAVTAMISDARLKAAADQIAKASQATEDEIALAEALASDVARVLESFSASTTDPGSLARRCAVRIQQGAKDVVQSEAETARTAVIAQRAAQAQSASADYDAFFRALEALLLRHVLEDETQITFVKLEGGAKYDAQLQCRTPYGLEWTVDLEIPASHPLAHVLKIDHVVERLEVEAPEEGGWITREVKNRPQRLDRLYLMALVLHPSETTIRLRAGADGTGAGFDILLRDDPAQVDLLRVQEGSVSGEAPYRVTGEDVARVRALRDSLAGMAADLAQHKKSLRDASLEGGALRALPSPRVLVERLVANIAPIVQEIGKRSLAPGELVLKRLLDDTRREEIFVSKKELARKVQVLPQDMRRIFDPLELASGGSVPPPAKDPALPSVIVTSSSSPPPPAPLPHVQQGAPVVPTRIVSASSIPPAPVATDGQARSKTSDRPPRP